MALRDAVHQLVERNDLSPQQAAEALTEIVSGEASPALVAAFLVALRMKGETPEEVAALAGVMRERAVPVIPRRGGLVDTCGTGGDGSGTLNVSTAAALVVAGAGVPVAKHGNRALSSRCGSADLLEALGVRLDLSAEQVAACIDRAGIGFLFAPAFHPSMAAVMPVRRELATRTVFNILGPLTNPARPSFQLVGVGQASLAGLVAGALGRLGVQRAVVVHGAGGADELTLAGESLALVVEDGVVSRRSIAPEDAGLARAPLEALAGGDPAHNAGRVRALLEGERGPFRDCVLLNAAAALWAAGAVRDLREGVAAAAESLDGGGAAAALEALASLSASG